MSSIQKTVRVRRGEKACWILLGDLGLRYERAMDYPAPSQILLYTKT